MTPSRLVFARLDPQAFEQCFLNWIESMTQAMGAQVIPIDGKKVRQSEDRSAGHKAIHVVSAWACEHRLVLGQIKVDDKSNEITAIPKLLDMLELAGCIITIDAMGCQKEIAAPRFFLDITGQPLNQTDYLSSDTNHSMEAVLLCQEIL